MGIFIYYIFYSSADRPDGEPVETVVAAVGIVMAGKEVHFPRADDAARVDLARPVVAVGTNAVGTRTEPVASRRQENVISIRRGDLISIHAIL